MHFKVPLRNPISPTQMCPMMGHSSFSDGEIAPFLSGHFVYKIPPLFPADRVLPAILLGHHDLGQVQIQPLAWLGGFIVLRFLLHILLLCF